MKKIYLLIFFFFGITSNVIAESNRIVSGQINAKITIIAYESLTCSHCANFHKDVYPQLKKDYLDTGLAESLYANQQEWVKGNNVDEINKNLKKYLEKSGFKIDFEKCINDKEIEDFVLNDRIEGLKKFKINATPTIIINNKKFEKSLNYKNLKKSLENLI